MEFYRFIESVGQVGLTLDFLGQKCLYKKKLKELRDAMSFPCSFIVIFPLLNAFSGIMFYNSYVKCFVPKEDKFYFILCNNLFISAL